AAQIAAMDPGDESTPEEGESQRFRHRGISPSYRRGRGSALYETRTFSARGPFGPWPLSKVTACPSRNWSKRVPWHAELWKKYSLPSSARMKPKPLSLTRRLIVPL